MSTLTICPSVAQSRPLGAYRLGFAAVGLVALTAAFLAPGAVWPVWAALILPDLPLVGFVKAPGPGLLPRWAVPAYNATHRLVGPLLLLVVAPFLGGVWVPVALAWLAHVCLDRAMGYDLRLADGSIRQ